MDINQKHWWDLIVEANKDNKEVSQVIESMNKTETNLDREEILNIRETIGNLGDTIDNSTLKALKRRYNMLENRAERQINDDFGVLLRHLRKSRSLSLAELGEKTGISPSYINRLELNQRKSPSINIMESLAKALGVPLSNLAQAAGIEFNSWEVIDLIELIENTNISLGFHKNSRWVMEEEDKEKLILIFKFILYNQWDRENEELINKLVDLVDDFKLQVKKNKSNNIKM